MKTKLVLIISVICNCATAQQNNSVPATLVLSNPVRRDTLYSENLISVDKGTIFSANKNYTLIAGKKIVLNSGTLTAPGRGYTHQFLIEPVSPPENNASNNKKNPLVHASITDKYNSQSNLKITHRNESGSANPTVVKLIAEPNPSNGIFNVTLRGTTTNVKKLKVYNGIGRIVFFDSFSNNENYKVDISDEPAGLYIITITDSINEYYCKIIIE